MELFAEIVNGFQPLTIFAKNLFIDAWQGPKFTLMWIIFVVRCTIWYHLYSVKKVKNTHEGMLLLRKLQFEACNFTKSNTPWVFFTFF